MLEKEIEIYLVKKAQKMGSVALKFVSPGHAGVPDRMVCLPGGHVVFVELKAPGKLSRPLQLHQQEVLRRLGFRVKVLDSKAKVDEFFASLGGG